MPTPFLSVVIVTWNSERWIQSCLESLVQQTWRTFETIIVDNNSQDTTLQLLHQYPVLTKQMPRNVGFCEGVNQGYRIAKGNFIFVLNPDVRLKPDCLEKLVNAIQKIDSDIGMIAPKLLNLEGNRIDTVGIKLSIIRRLFNIGEGEVDQGQYDHKTEIFGPCGAAAVYSRQMLEILTSKGEVFDPIFFAYAEDFDLCWRAQRAGFRALFVPSAVGCHARGGSAIEKEKKQYLSWRNRYFLLLKNESLWNFLIRSTLMFFYDFPRLLYFLIMNSYRWKALEEVSTVGFRLLKNRRKFGS